MMENRFGKLEVLSQSPAGGAARETPLLFIHGAYADAWCWAENFLPFFAEAGWQAYAVSLSGHGSSAGRDHLDSLSISDYVRDVSQIVARLPARPVLIGHSMGGFVVQKFLEQETVPAAVLMAAVPPHGLLGSAFGLAFSKPALMTDLNRIMGGSGVALETLREALFAQPVSTDRLMHFMRHMQPESHRALWDMTLFDLPRISRMHRPPMLILGADFDHLIPASAVEMTGRAYGIEPEFFAGMGHGLMLEADWRKVAQRIDEWLQELPIA
jgi:pimeloyl-ACP methyl ester carboxylesterase